MNFGLPLGTIAGLVIAIVAVLEYRRRGRETRLEAERAAREEERAAREEERLRRAEERRDSHSKPALCIESAPGFSGTSGWVTVYANIGNDGAVWARKVLAEALIDDEVVATSRAVDVAPHGKERVELEIPRQFVEGLQGEAPRYTGGYSLRVRARGSAGAEWQNDR